MVAGRIRSVHPQEPARDVLGGIAAGSVLRERFRPLDPEKEGGDEEERGDRGEPEDSGGDHAHGRRLFGRERGRRRRRDEAFVRVGQSGLRQESAPSEIEEDRRGQRQQEDSRGHRAGKDVIGVSGTEQEERRVGRVDREVPDEERQRAVPQEKPAHHDAGRSHLDAADVERLVRICGVPEPPDQGGHHDRDDAARSDPVQERDREHAADAFFRDRRQEPDQENGRPGKGRIQHVAVRDVRGRPGAQPRRHYVEDRLVGEEERGERVAEHDTEEEPLGPHSAP